MDVQSLPLSMVPVLEQPKLKPVNRGSNRWCGPAALSIITGLDTDRAAKLLR